MWLLDIQLRLRSHIRVAIFFILAFFPYDVKAQENFVIKEFVPAGFENLEEQEVENYLDVYFFGRPITAALVKYDKEFITILNLDEILDRVDGIKNKSAVKASLSGKIKNNYEKACPYQKSKNKKKRVVAL